MAAILEKVMGRWRQTGLRHTHTHSDSPTIFKWPLINKKALLKGFFYTYSSVSLTVFSFSASVSILLPSLLFTAAQQARRPLCIQGDAHMTFMTVCVIILIYLHNDYLFMKLYLGRAGSVWTTSKLEKNKQKSLEKKSKISYRDCFQPVNQSKLYKL